MIERIVNFAVARRWFVLLMTLIAALLGSAALMRLPIDAVPDVTNNQVQINIVASALSPNEVEKQVARSEEHTSELQSTMHIQYAVFRFKKIKKHNTTHTQHTQ